MKKLTIKRTLVTLLATALLASCSNPERDFEKAEQANTEEAYGVFLQRHPNSPLSARARSNLAKVSYENVKRTNTVAALESFLSRFPSSDFSSNARTALESLEFELAGRANTEMAWESFLSKYTNSSLATAGREGLGKCVFARVSQENTAAGYEAFLTKHADCSLVSDAREKLAALLLAEALAANTVSAYESVVQKLPGTKAAGEARKSWAKMDHDTCVKENTIAAYEQFLSRHSDSEWVPDVRARLEAQMEQRDWANAQLEDSAASYIRYWKAHTNSSHMKVLSGTFKPSIGLGPNMQLAVWVALRGGSSDCLELSQAQQLGFLALRYEGGAATLKEVDSIPDARLYYLKDSSKKTGYRVLALEDAQGEIKTDYQSHRPAPEARKTLPRDAVHGFSRVTLESKGSFFDLGSLQEVQAPPGKVYVVAQFHATAATSDLNDVVQLRGPRGAYADPWKKITVGGEMTLKGGNFFLAQGGDCSASLLWTIDASDLSQTTLTVGAKAYGISQPK
jgi:outer membrane protein assembly factor BamD (BamD/ComL family)